MSKGTVKWVDGESIPSTRTSSWQALLGIKESRVLLAPCATFCELLPRTLWLPFSPGEPPGEKPAVHILEIYSYGSLIQSWLLSPIFSTLRERMSSIGALLQSSIRHHLLAHALFWCHLLGDIEDDSKSFYLLSACCELSIYISNFKFSHDPARTVLNPFLSI